jgi:16S rRNA (adenine1518-N6/adenine1519-N6)-dimethyltransferase
MASPRQVTLARLHELGITPDTRLGQHFLIDDNLVRVALRLAEVSADDVVLEVGPGLGVLTAALADAARRVHAIELDRRLAPALETTLAGRTNVAVVYGDALHITLEDLDPPPTAFVANLPYNVATPLVAESLGRLPSVERWCVMVQREAADRLLARPGTPAYGAVSVLVQLVCEPRGRHPVSRHVFAPPPRVDSALVALRRRATWPALAPRFAHVTGVVHAAFAHRRKTLANALQLAGVAPAATAAALASLGLPAAVRAERLTPEELLALADRLAPAP